jgi:hypothetical protein
MFEEMLGDIDYENEEFAMGIYPFKVRVGMPYRRPPRHDMWEYLLEMGRHDIDLTFSGETFEGRDTLTFVFPERWMNVSEQRHLMHALKQHPEGETLKQVDIITHSPLILGDFHSSMIRVLKWDDDIIYEHEKDIKFSME